MAWTAQLIGDHSDLAVLAKSLTTSELRVFHDGQNYVLASDTFAHAADAAAVRQAAEEIVALMNGAARLKLDTVKLIGVGAIYRKPDSAPPEIYVLAEPAVIRITAAASVRVVHTDGTCQEHHPADPIKKWLAIGRLDAAVGKVFRILASGTMDGVNLYRILEIVSEDSGGLDTIASSGWATKRSLKLFKHTANSPGAIGLDARHCAETTQAPAAPMTISEAKSLLSSTVHAWLRAKIDVSALRDGGLATESE